MTVNSKVWEKYLHTLSVLFPAWERSFAAVAVAHRGSVTAPLAERIDEFVKEELAHASAHEAYNQRHGLVEAAAEETRKAAIVHLTPRRKVWLGTMVSIEHLASCMGRMYLDNAKGGGRDGKLFEWHSKEEIGHKDLAMDVWRECGYSGRSLRSIAMKNQSYVIGFIVSNVWRCVDRKNPRDWSNFIAWFWWMTKRVFIPMLAIYLPRFHPNWFDDSRYGVAA